MAFAVSVPPGKSKGRSTPAPNINVTPLVDVILVVLIIFMMVTPMMMKTFWLNVPKAAQENKVEEKPPEPAEVDDAKKPLVMTVDRKGLISINRNVIPKSELATRLPRLLAAKENKVLYFDAHDEAPYGVAASVMDLARAAGARSIAIMAQAVPQ
jgi:biopolymer transport protein ExbD/biopolymer transport protein TolR